MGQLATLVICQIVPSSDSVPEEEMNASFAPFSFFFLKNVYNPVEILRKTSDGPD